MVVINTKKIFITILVSIFLLVGSALTVFAFDFSAPNYNDEIYFINYDTYSYDMYNFVDIDGDEQRYFRYVGSFKCFFNIEDELTTKKYVLSLSKYGFDFLSQNGANAQSMKSVLDDFIDGNIGNITAVYYSAKPMGGGYIFEDFQSTLASEYQYYPEWFDVITDLNNQFFNYESQYNTLNSQLISLQSQYNTLLSQYQQLLQDYQNLQTVNSDLQTALQELANEYNTLNTQYGDLRLQYETLETQYNELETRYNDLSAFYSEELTRLLNENNELRSYLQNADIQINTLEGEILRLQGVVAQEYMKGYTQAFADYDLFEDGLYSIFSAPFTIVYELAEIEVFGFSIVRIVGIILLFVLLSFILAFIWKVIPLL